MAVSVKTWHSTIFAPYFVVGAVHSGVSAVAFVMIILRYIYGWQNYIRHEHIDALGRLLIVVATGWFYFFVMEILFGFYGREADELAVRDLQFMQNPWNIWMMVFVFTTYFLPVALWLPRAFRRNLWIMSTACISVNIGMWLERFIIIVPGLQNKQVFTFSWYSVYTPSPVEWAIVGATFAAGLTADDHGREGCATDTALRHQGIRSTANRGQDRTCYCPSGVPRGLTHPGFSEEGTSGI